jgi:hypothetical protein
MDIGRQFHRELYRLVVGVCSTASSASRRVTNSPMIVLSKGVPPARIGNRKTR